MFIPRHLTALLKNALETLPVVVLTGPRQVGKSTLLRHDAELKKRRYFSLDDATMLAGLLRDPQSILSIDEPVVIDEAQRAPALFPAIKLCVDANPTPGRFILSGSANFLLMHSIAESLAGRAVYLSLGPLSFREIRRVTGATVLARIMRGEPPGKVLDGARILKNPDESAWLAGGFPAVLNCKNDDARRLWFTGYEQTYLDRDLRALSQVADLGLFERFLRLSALRTAQILNQRDLARDCGSNPMTMTRWLSILETGFLVHRLPPYFSNISKQFVKSPKLYFTDSGLAAFLCGIHTESDLRRHPLRGALAETYVFQNLRELFAATMPEAKFFHYRSHDGYEVDFIIEAGQRRLALEMKAGSSVDARDLKGLDRLVGMDQSCVAGLVVYSGADVKQLGAKIWAVPISAALT